MTRKMMSLTGLLMAAVAIGLVSAAGDEDVFEIQPEIHHVFREAEKMPPAMFSTLFSLIALAPWLLLAVGWLQIGYTPQKIVSDLVSGPTLRTVYISSFLGSLVALEYLFYLYWTENNLLQTLPYFAGLSVVAFITGQRALSSIQK